MIVRKFIELLHANKRGHRHIGVFSICSAHPVVLESAMRHAMVRGYLLLIEATSNQVNQFGGYTGMTPQDFVEFIRNLAKQSGYPFEQILLGGDHLGPNFWSKEPASLAMEKASEMVRQYVSAGFRKIHLDASMFCADDYGDRTKPLEDSVVAERAALLCQVAEQAWEDTGHAGEPPCYIIGTEVPIPGGMVFEHHTIRPTSPEDAVRTLEVTRSIFNRYGLESVWDRVVALVVQPGVEFGDDEVAVYDPVAAAELHRALQPYDSIVCEAHSTDYQPKSALHSLVADHCCILKVGPWVTYAYREALYALESIEIELLAAGKVSKRSQLRETIENTMRGQPEYWKNYYAAGPELSLKLSYSYSDRIRYYWFQPEVSRAVDTLVRNLERIGIPNSLVSQFFPIAYQEILEGRLENSPGNLIIHHVQQVLELYADACGL